jgi:hypothetical protein
MTDAVDPAVTPLLGARRRVRFLEDRWGMSGLLKSQHPASTPLFCLPGSHPLLQPVVVVGGVVGRALPR